MILLILALSTLLVGGLIWHGVNRVEALFHENVQLRESLDRLLTEDTLGHLYLQSRTKEPDGTVTTRVTWFETAAPDHARTARVESFTVKGETVYLDGFLIRFPPQMVADGKARALYFWRRAFGNAQTPDAGHPLDDGEGPPARYAPIFGETFSSSRGELFWASLWDLAHSPEALERYGIEAVFGNALVLQPRMGYLYTVKLSAGGALTVETAPLSTGTLPKGV